jgi:hypothetical protein
VQRAGPVSWRSWLGGVLGGGEGDGEAEGFELADVAADLALGADPLVVVAGAEVGEPCRGVGEQVETPAGFDYTAADCRSWMADIGFRDTYAEPLPGPDSMVVGVK